MAFTVCVVLLAVLSSGSDLTPNSRLDVLVIVWATTVGLALVRGAARDSVSDRCRSGLVHHRA